MLTEAQDRDLARYLDLHAGLNRPLPHLEIADRRAQRDRHEQIATAYAAQVREAIPTVSDELLDDWRRAAESYGARVIVGDLPGDELARLCDEELAGRRVSIPHIDADAVSRAILTDRADRIAANAAAAVGAVAGIVALGAAAQVVALFVGSIL
ncbi:hypothetical protein DK419_13370 [Methylobacterium terrae]|uniref:Uncharacterized protein n=1 Tax=Methylobacterium terrae TaxID=2202827 RepID=A0A2U8WLQ6_9HYPH|nr:hypothetical protein [Methylobacterium terrae]AWN47184.1 hypothetical protein DK419_13370 [Methylobacterium terrae]